MLTCEPQSLEKKKKEITRGHKERPVDKHDSNTISLKPETLARKSKKKNLKSPNHTPINIPIKQIQHDKAAFDWLNKVHVTHLTLC